MFNMSFIDLLAGALGAVVMLFIIIPKVDIEQMEELEALAAAEFEIKSLDSLLIMVKSSVPDSDYTAIIEQTQRLQMTIGNLRKDVNELQGQLSQKIQEKKQLEQQLSKLENQNEALRKKVSDLQKRQPKSEEKEVPEKAPLAENQPDKEEEDYSEPIDTTPGIGDFQMGFNPPLTVMIEWESKDHWVHLYMKPKDSNFWCFYQSKRRVTPFGKWARFKFKKTPYEAIVQDQELTQGEYEIYAQLDKPRSGGETIIQGFIAANPKEGVPQMIRFGDIKVQSTPPPYHRKATGDALLGYLTIQDNKITWDPVKEPIIQ